MTTVVITNLTRGTTLASQARRAGGMLQRLVGLLARRTFSPGEALVIPRCNGIHTWFMRFPIDVVFMNRAGYVVKTIPRVPAFRMVWALGARTAIELPAGTLAKTVTKPGELLRIKEAGREGKTPAAA